jgi:UDP-N-acetylmuramoyl-tripeptide--D-alanyl-D-alanine ligase
MKKILFLKLKILAKLILKKYRPLIIGITGSVGKTSAKEAIYSVLKSSGRVGRSRGNYNNEIGVPLTIIGSLSGGRSLLGWLAVFLRALGLLIGKDKNYPEILILEMGAEKIGDLEYLTSFVPVDIGVITGIGGVHLEFFGSLENVAKEKLSLLRHFEDDGKVAVINLDDQRLKESRNNIKGKILTYGFDEGADFRAGDFKIVKKQNSFGGLFKLHYRENTIPVFLANVLGRQQVYASLAALAVATSLKVSLLEAVDDLTSGYNPPKGRTNLIKGIKDTLIIDDSYNASPPSSLAALETLADFPEGDRKLAIFGAMLELGNYTEEGHREVGRKAAEVGVDMLVAVGEMSRDIIRGAISAGLPEEQTFYFDNNHDAGVFVQNKLREGDLILIKGSQGARMERIVKELMAEPLKAKDLLVRQSDSWLKR